jgi:DNA-binding response OmpR family regulator
MRVLLVEDDELFGSAVHHFLMREGYAVDWIRTGRDVAVAMRAQEYDTVLLDLGLPDIGGEKLLTVMRNRDPGICVVVVTARGGIQERIRLLDLGAADYMVKPIDLDELCARVRAVCRHAPSIASGHELEHGPLKLHPARHAVTWREQPVALTPKEYSLLEIFLRKKGHVLTRVQLEEALYRWEEEVASNAVEVHVHHLRGKFGSTIIQTVRGVGYQLGAEDAFQ